jgi:hypothetical protein
MGAFVSSVRLSDLEAVLTLVKELKFKQDELAAITCAETVRVTVRSAPGSEHSSFAGEFRTEIKSSSPSFVKVIDDWRSNATLEMMELKRRLLNLGINADA